jgi:hypothetical protein
MGRECWVLCMCVGWAASTSWAADVSPSQKFLEFVRTQAAALRAQDSYPQSAAEWQQRREQLRSQLEAAWGGFPAEPCPLNPHTVGVLQKDGYRIEKLLLRSLPDVWMPALAYVPDAPGKHPAILSVHGHWKGAKVEPTIQSRCIGAVKLGFFVLCVDAFGAGERGLGKQLGEYHGEMVAATLFPTGRPLSGIQVYENLRCVDYLQSRPEVDPEKLGITGASGGGNQSMYAGAWDERFAAVVPVCSVGNYQAYLGSACCMCEVVPGALKFTEEWGVLGLTAPRALMPCNVTRDGIQFSIQEARKSLVGAQMVYDVLGQPNQLYHSTFRGRHDYHQPIREAMYGWMAQHLKGQGDGSPIPEPAHVTEDPESLRLFPGNSRPDDWLTLPQFAAREGRTLLQQLEWPRDTSGTPRYETLRKTLIHKVLGGFPAATGQSAAVLAADDAARQRFVSEPGIELTLESLSGDVRGLGGDVVLVLDLQGGAAVREHPLTKEFLAASRQVVTLDLRATGELAHGREQVGRAPDHHTAEWSLLIGRPLLGQWTWDVLRGLQELEAVAVKNQPLRVQMVGIGPAGLVALCTAAVTDRVEAVAAVNTLTSYVSPVPYEGQRLGTIVPGVLRDLGDIPHLAALSQARRTVIAGGVTGGNQPVSVPELQQHYDAQLDRVSVPATQRPVIIGSWSDWKELATQLQTSPRR